MDEALVKIETILTGVFGREGASLLVEDLKIAVDGLKSSNEQSSVQRKKS